MGFNAALLALVQLGQDGRARAIAEDAIVAFPDTPEPLTARGILTYPSEAALTDFRRAAGLPGARATPFYHLAHDAYRRGRLAEAEGFCRQALDRHPPLYVQATLYGWIAAFRDSAGAPTEEVEALFRQAFAAHPGHEQVAELYKTFKADVAPVGAGRAARWNTKADKLVDGGGSSLSVDLLGHIVPSRRAA